jgi:riboflavin kinase
MAERTETLDSNSATCSFRSSVLLKKIEFSGTVISGDGDGEKFMELPWVKRQITEKLGFTPYPGTLNVKLTEESAKQRKLVEKTPSAKVLPAEGYSEGLLFKAFIGIVQCAIVIPQVAGYPNDLLEVIASVYLREALQLEDGCEVTVTANL